MAGLVSDNNTLELAADLADTGYHPDHAHWIGTRDSFELVVRRGMTFPGCPSGTWFRSAGADIVFNDMGQISFNAIMSGPATERISYDSRWIGQPGYLQWISYDGEPVQGMPEGVTWRGCGNGSSTTNASGELTEVAYIQGPGITDDNEVVLFFGDSEEIHLVAQEGDPAPEAGPDVYMDFFGNSRINNRHEMFYNVSYRGEGITESNRQAIYFGKLHQGKLELRDGNHAPTFPEDVTLRQVVSVQNRVAMNDVGDIVCATQIQGGDVTDDNNVVLWLRHRILKRWIPLLRSGDTIFGRTIFAEDENDIGNGYKNHTGGADGKPQSLNDSCTLAIVLKFTDGTKGIVRISPPVFGDADEDLDVDSEDWLAMSACCMGPDTGAEPACEVFDLDLDGDVDMVDQSMFQQLVTGS